MAIEMELCGLKVEKNVKVAVEYKGQSIGEYFIDILVEDAVILELKSVERHDPVFEAQILSYIKLTGKKVCYQLNSNVKDGTALGPLTLETQKAQYTSRYRHCDTCTPRTHTCLGGRRQGVQVSIPAAE
jgi:GxxExxY protein